MVTTKMTVRARLGAAFVAAALFGAARPAAAVAVGETLPGITVKHHAAGELGVDALRDKVTVINFWATWCAACKVELVEMEDLLKPMMAEKDFQVAFVSLDKDPAKAAEWFQANFKEPEAFLKRLYVDPAFETADKLAVDSFPMTLVIGRDGKVAHVQRGFKEGEGSTQQIVKVTSELLKVAHH